MAALTPSLYRVPFLLVNAYMGQIAAVPPNRPAESNEQQRYDVNKKREPLTKVMGWWLPTFLIIMHGLNVAEIYVTLATAFPAIRSILILSFLLPSEDLVRPLAYRLTLTPLFVGGTLLASFGALIRLWCYHTLGRFFTFELSLRKEHKLITSGPYSIVRHPSYLGSTCYFTGLLACQFSQGSWWVESGLWDTSMGRVIGTWWLLYVAFLLVSLVIIRVPKEDKVLQEEFGQQWVEWSKKTPYRVIPGVY